MGRVHPALDHHALRSSSSPLDTAGSPVCRQADPVTRCQEQIMAQREFERRAANRVARPARRSDATERAGAIGRSWSAAPGSDNGRRAPVPTPQQGGAALLRLQRSHGNRFVQQLVTGVTTAPIIKPKLVVGPADDRYEREADQVAHQMTSGQAVRAPGAAGPPPVIRRLSGIDGGPVDAGVQQAVQAARGGGQSLPGGLRSSMEQALGADFGGVRVHTDAQADHLNRALRARAFTTGQDLFFRRGEYDPSSAGGQEVLAHELTHVVQQGSTVTAGAIQRMKIGLKGKVYDTESSADRITIKTLLNNLSYEDARDVFFKAMMAAKRAGEAVQAQAGFLEVRDHIGTFKDTGYGPTYNATPPGSSDPTGIAIPSNPPPGVIIPSGPQASNVAAGIPPASTQTATRSRPTARNVAAANPPASTQTTTSSRPTVRNVAAANPPASTQTTTRSRPTAPNVAAANPPASTHTTTSSRPTVRNVAAANPPASTPITANVGQAAAVLVEIPIGAAKGTYNLRDSARRQHFIDAILSNNTTEWQLGKYKEYFAAAVSGPPNVEPDFADVTKALADKSWEFAHPSAARQLEGYKSFASWSAHPHPMFGSTNMKRVQLWELPSQAKENAELQTRGYQLSMTFHPQAAGADNDRATAVVTHIANALHNVGARGVDLQQVVKVNDKKELYFLSIHIPPTPSHIEVTLDAVRSDDAATGQVVGLHQVDTELSRRLWPGQGAVTLQAYFEALKGPESLAMYSEQWRTDEIELLGHAVRLVPDAHWTLLSTLRFMRVKSLPGRGGAATGDPAAAAEYYPTDPPVICITDKVTDPNFGEYFYDDKTKKILPQGVRLIVHEVGHAVSLEKWRRAAVNYKATDPSSRAALDLQGGTGAMEATPIKDMDQFIARNEYVTDYAASLMDQSLRDKARAELFAEAYSLWRTNPGYLTGKHKKLAKWFAQQQF